MNMGSDRGAWAAVRQKLEAKAGQGTLGADERALLASACLATGDLEGADTHADAVLRLDASNIRASLVKADGLNRRGALKEANFFYRAVVELAGGRSDLPPDLAGGVARARALRENLAKDIFGHVRAELDRVGYAEGRSSARFAHALDLATGKRKPYFQQPQAFYFPELGNTQFFAREQFPWLDAIEAETDAITAELEAVLAADEAFAPYIRTVPNLPSRSDYPLVDSMDWSSCFLWKDGERTAFAEKCPRTMAALEAAPLCQVKGRSPQVMFSQLKAGAHIRPHTGFVNTRLICHLPLVVPPNCRFRVGNEVREWERGKAWVFDDTIEHEAINQSDRTRVVLIFDIWRPELTEEERGLVSALLESMDAFSPTTQAWE